ncbi:peptide-N-glycosidase F-related protein [Flavobacterium capsici]|uniref:Peptide-N-glycosidase F-related protein n=1 Tax=Flavobacterium capsici TaxID=3075618 RepID=A0AA96JBB2_9FLAO|nr:MULTISPECIES: peptide-N-glycosidase F-related protein [unclassified Flavobacterium]WNM18403.1 peptide-N-glycosidase F-related protein [Flavobacterium sp. PMR2A8]WNM22454.1 peptide-N-glycosidase F-related protein [Flavobacterium sp. PMTSA4]
MKTKLLLLFLISSFFTTSKAQTYINVYDNVLFYDGYAGLVSAPTPPDVFRLRNDLFTTKLTQEQLAQIGNILQLDVTISAACDNYDRIGNVNLVLVPKGNLTYDTNTALKIEIGRFITPFMNKNISPTSVPYSFTVSNIAKILKDTTINLNYDFWVELEVFGVPYAAQTQVVGCSGRNDVFYGTLNFITNTNSFSPENTFLLPLNFKKDLNNYQTNATDVIGQTIRTINYILPQDINNASYYLITSNHGANAGGEEYNRRWHYIYHDNNSILTYKPGESTCEPYRIYNTQGNGIYGSTPRTPAQWQSFSNWCPGAKIPIRTIGMNNLTAGSHSFKIEVPEAVFVDGQGYIPVSLYIQGESAALNINDIESYSYDIYPNPSSDFINIKGTDVINSYQLIDSQGRILVSSVYNDKDLKLDLTNYSKGIYFLKMNFDKGTNTERIIKQ